MKTLELLKTIDVLADDMPIEMTAGQFREAVESIMSEARLKILRLDVKSEQRYLSDSGFWSKRELVDKNEVIEILLPKEAQKLISFLEGKN